MGRSRYEDPAGDMTRLIWKAANGNFPKVNRLRAARQAKAAQRKIKCAA